MHFVINHFYKTQFFFFQIENRALRLRDSVTAAAAAAQYMEDMAPSTSPAEQQSQQQQQQQLQQQQQPHIQLAAAGASAADAFNGGDGADNRPAWDYFDEAGYIQRGGLRTGENPYERNRFNQQASDLLPSNRNIPDTRNSM